MKKPFCIPLLALFFMTAWSAVCGTTADYVVTLHVQPTSQEGRIDAITVDEAIRLPVARAGDTLLAMPHVSSNVPTVARSVGELKAHDDDGPLQLHYRDRGEDADRERQWFASRDTRGTLRFSYRASMTTALAARGAAPPTELRSEGGAFSGAASTFLLHPPSGRYDVQLEWDMAGKPPRVHALSSLQGARTHTLDMDTLDSVYVMAGRMGQYPEKMDSSGFFSGWQGKPPFDAEKLLAWAQRLRQHYQGFFDAPATPYSIFLRRNRVNPGGGMGMYHSFIATYDDNRGNDPDELKITLAHEMFHTFQPRMSPDEGDSPLSVSWFNEGLAVFYQARLPFRYGMIDADTLLKDINYTAARYYTDILGNTPNSEVPAGFWKDTRIRTLPYDRGFLYFVTVDEAMRKQSRGKRSLDDLVLAMLSRQEQQQSIDIGDWEAVLQDNLGEEAVARLHAMLDGASPLPSSDAFGSCFERVSRPLHRYQLGFAPEVLTESPRIVRGLIPDSAAARAGVRNGDKIIHPVGQDRIQGEQDGVLTLELERDGEEALTVSYKPRAEKVDAWQWQRKAATAHMDCSLPGGK